MPSRTLNIGLLMLPGYQWLDAVGTVDIINNHSYALLSMIRAPQALLDKSPIIHWHWISATMDPVPVTTGPPQPPSCTFATAPENLDYVIVPGPDPTAPLPEGCAEWLEKKVLRPEEEGGVKLLLTVCTGSLAIAFSTTLLDGLKVCTNKMALKMVAEMNGGALLNKKVKWVGDRRWCKDGRVWSAAGITAGLDLAVEFVRVHFDEEVVRFAELIGEYKGKPDQPDEFAAILQGVKLD